MDDKEGMRCSVCFSPAQVDYGLGCKMKLPDSVTAALLHDFGGLNNLGDFGDVYGI